MNNIDDITKFIFLENVPQKADIIFVPGGSYPDTMELACKLWKDGYAPYILPSGKYSIKLGCFPGPKTRKEIYDGNYRTEWEYMRDIAVKNGVDPNAIIKEDEAQSTIENAIYSRKATDDRNMKIEKAIICCKNFHSRRCLMLYSSMYPEVEFMLCTSEIKNINKNNWYKSQYGIERVMGELARCGDQLRDAVKVWRKFKE